MPVRELGQHEVVTVWRDNTVLEAAKLMRLHGVGDLQVIEERDGVHVAVGTVTDRDLVVEIMAPELDYMVITVGDIIDLRTIYT